MPPAIPAIVAIAASAAFPTGLTIAGIAISSSVVGAIAGGVAAVGMSNLSKPEAPPE